MPDVSWKEAIIQVLRSSSEPLHYTQIADTIFERGLRVNVGATPPRTVNGTITTSLKDEGDNSPFVRVATGFYTLKGSARVVPQVPVQIIEEAAENTGLINAFGMYWTRNDVLWSLSKPHILGKLQEGSTTVDFYDQNGVYLLHDGRAVVYVGRTTEQPLGLRLRQHTVDRLKGRWDRFTWFGVYPVREDGALNTTTGAQYSLEMLIITMEALLIEGLEPPQNRKRGDEFRAIEFLQVEDPEIQKAQMMRSIDELKRRL
jgi:hypothetical protein